MDITPSEGLLSWEAVPRNGEATFSRVASILRKMEPGVSHRSECGLGTVVGRDIKKDLPPNETLRGFPHCLIHLPPVPLMGIRQLL